MGTVESEFVTPGQPGESLASLLDALDRENAELRERLVSLGGDAARSAAELKFAREAFEEARAEVRAAEGRLRSLAEERDHERASAMIANGARDALQAVSDERSTSVAALERQVLQLEDELRATQLREEESRESRAALQRELEVSSDLLNESGERVRSLEEKLRVAASDVAGFRRMVETHQEVLEQAEVAHRRTLATAKRHKRRAAEFEASLKSLRSSRAYRVMRVLWRVKAALTFQGHRAARRERKLAQDTTDAPRDEKG